MPIAPPTVVPLVFVGLIGWRVYRRIRRGIGRQRVRAGRLTAGIIIYSVLCVLIALSAMRHPKALEGLGAGLILGIPLALVALHFTRYETTPEGRFYTSHPFIGISITALFVVRMFYRMATIFGGPAQNHTAPVVMQSALTLALFGLLAGYYITYNAGVLVCSGRARATEIPHC